MLYGERLDLEHGRRHPGHDGHGRGLGRPDGAPPGAGETRPEERLYHAGAGQPATMGWISAAKADREEHHKRD
jgi:hypothetical protein